MAEQRSPNVFEAWHAVMTDVSSIAKSDRNDQQKFNFRGIDAVMQSVGPALRAHGVFIIPTGTEMRTETYSTKSGTTMRNVTVTMQFRVYGPAGDYFDGTSFGEAADSGDKAVTKAQSVAYRTFLLQSLTVPTGDPDPDASTHERSSAPPRTDLDDALDELGDMCAGLGLAPQDVAQRFIAQHKKPPRYTDAKTVRDFIATLQPSLETA
jgi:hypothetical protein